MNETGSRSQKSPEYCLTNAISARRGANSDYSGISEHKIRHSACRYVLSHLPHTTNIYLFFTFPDIPHPSKGFPITVQWLNV
jgi:hypothetical protein